MIVFKSWFTHIIKVKKGDFNMGVRFGRTGGYLQNRRFEMRSMTNKVTEESGVKNPLDKEGRDGYTGNIP